MKQQFNNYVLASPHNPSFLFYLKQPQLIANNNNYFDQTAFFLYLQDTHKIYPMTYYHIRYTKVCQGKVMINIIEAIPIATVGNQWQCQQFLHHMKSVQGSLKQPEADSKFMKQVLEHGQLRVNDQGWIYVKSSQSGFRKKLKIVNHPFPLPLLKGCKVEFFLRKYAENQGPKVKISALNFKPIKLAGILKMINGRIFFEPRHTDYDRMIPISIPEPLMEVLYECMPNYRMSLPYTIFKRYDGDHALVNKKLASFVLKGKFVDWPIKFSHPVIQIESIEPMNCSNLKNATLYELGIPLLDYDSQENALSEIIINNFKAQSYINRQRITDKCYSFDCEGSSCYDDAFSFKKTQKGFKIGIHISDVPELVSGYPYLLKKALSRDQTIYIKNYYRSMFPEQLRNIMSLVQHRPRLVFSLFFEISKSGIIDYKTISFQESVIKVDCNLIHGDLVPKEDRQMINQFRQTLDKCKDLEKFMLFDEIGTAVMTNQLLFLSSYLPMLTFENNFNNLQRIIKASQQYLNQICGQVQKYICNIKVKSSQQNQKSAEINRVEQKQNSEKSSIDCEIIDIAEQIKVQNMKEVPLTKFSSSMQYLKDTQSTGSVDEQTFTESYDENQNGKKNQLFFQNKNVSTQKNEFFRKASSKEGSAAECYRFLDKLFRAAGLEVDFSHTKSIEYAFKECQKKYNDKIVELYFRTKLIMSRQHFDVISRLAKEGKLKNFELDNAHFKYPAETQKKQCSANKIYTQSKVEQEVSISIPNKVTTSDSSPTKTEKSQAFEREKELVKLQEKVVQKNQQQLKDGVKKEEDEVSRIWNILNFIVDHGITFLTRFSKEQLTEKILQLRQYAKEHKIELIERTFTQREANFNRDIMQKVCQTPWNIEGQKNTLKWNTPIRSGASLQALSLIKNHSWLFEGSLSPSILITKHKQAKAIKDQIQHLISQKSHQESVQLNGRMKQAVRQLGKIDFLFVLRQQPDKVWDFITITSPSHRVQFVYHEFIQQVEVDNPQKNINYYSRVRGRFKGIFDFPIKLKVVLEN